MLTGHFLYLNMRSENQIKECLKKHGVENEELCKELYDSIKLDKDITMLYVAKVGKLIGIKKSLDLLDKSISEIEK